MSAALAAAVLLLYSRTANFDFVSLDDHVYVTENPTVLRGLTAEGVQWAISTFHTGNWHPLTWVSHMADTSLFGPGPAGRHVSSMLVHALTSVVLFWSLRLMTGALWPSALAAALFALHPLRAESVAWISERKDVLGGLFWMLTLLVYQWYTRQPTAVRYAFVVVVFGLGLSAKAMLVTLPVVLLLADVWPLRRYRPAWLAIDNDPAPPAAFPRQSGVRLLLEKVPLLALVAATSSLTVAAQRFGLALQDVSTLSVEWRVVNALDAYATYLRKSIAPYDLAAFYPHPGFLREAPAGSDIAGALVAALVIVVISVLVLRYARRIPALAFGWLWYLGTLIPVIGLVQVGEQAYADRYSYVPSIGIAIMIAWGLATLIAQRPPTRNAVITGCVAALLGLGIATWIQVGTWRDSKTLFTHAVAVTHDNYFALASLGNGLRSEGQLDSAADHLQRALAIKPDFTYALTGYGAVLERQGKLDEAAAQLEQALRINPSSARAIASLGLVRQRQGRAQEAATLLDQAVRMDPSSSFAHANLGVALLTLQRPAEAIPHLQQALRLSPTAETYNNLGVAQFRLQRYPEAAAAFERSLQLRPDYANARTGLERARRQLGQR